MYLRIAPELYQSVSGGGALERPEINRNFRNEGSISVRHNRVHHDGTLYGVCGLQNILSS